MSITRPTLYHRTLHADLETPVTAYLKLRSLSPWAFLYESLEGPLNWARYSILGFGAQRTLIVQNQELHIHNCNGDVVRQAHDPLQAIRAALQENPLGSSPEAPGFVGGIFGYLSYDAARSFEILSPPTQIGEVPDACFIEPALLAVFDNQTHSLKLYAHDEDLLAAAHAKLRETLPPCPAAATWKPPIACTDRPAFIASVEAAKEYIRAGEIIQVVLSRQFRQPALTDPFNVYRGLRTINPSPYLYYMNTPSLSIAGASPEVMVRVQNGEMTVRPIAGTRPKSQYPRVDTERANELLADPKERAEHIMLVDLGRNDLGRVCEPGSVKVADFMVVEHYSHVMHIVSEVRGQLSDSTDAFDALRASFPAGTLTGAPKVRAMQIIDEFETQRRGIYGGAVGYFGPHGDADFGIAIRTLVATPNQFTIQAGAGIVADSDPEREADETEHKAQAVIRATQWAASSQAAW